MSGFGDFLGEAGSSGLQLFIWQVLGQLVGDLVTPFSNALVQAVNSADPNVPLTPALLADLVNRHLVELGEAESVAAKSGIDKGPLSQMVLAAGTAPDLGAVMQAYQRKMIPKGTTDPTEASLYGALADSGVRDQWLTVLEELTVQIPSGAEVMNAWLEGQIDEAEARTRYLAAGGDPTWFQTSYNANGQAPTPVQALELLNRGIIVESGTGPASTSYEQAFLEGPWRNKWLPVFLALKEYLPPPRTVTALFHEGAISHDKAASLLVKQGLAADLAADYLTSSTKTKTATEKHVARSDLFALYVAKLISESDLTAGLVALGYDAHDAALLVKLGDLKTKTGQLSAGVSRVRTLYEAGKIDATTARANLATLLVPANQIPDVIAIWDVELAKQVKTLTAPQVLDLWEYEVQDTKTTVARLGTLGYDQADALDLVAIKNKGPLNAAQIAGGSASVE